MGSFKQLLFVAALPAVLSFTLASSSVNGQSPRIFIVDRLVAEEVTHVDGITGTDKIFNLPDKGNPLILIIDELKKNSYSEVHLFLLTKPGSMIFDELNILLENIEQYASQFMEWKKYLPPGAKIIIHSDSLASVEDGATLVQKISELTGASVIAQN
jgi:hypothetical protein